MKKVVLLFFVFLFLISSSVFAIEVGKLEDAVKEYVKSKAQYTGTFDLYDGKINRVRNLRFIKYHEGVAQEEGMVSKKGDYRDITNGDVVEIEFVIEDLKVVKVNVGEVKTVKEKKEEQKEYTDTEIQNTMRDLLVDQAKFTGSTMLYDEKNSKMRKLELVEFNPEIRRFGKRFISTAKFVDKESSENLMVDVNIRREHAGFEIKSMKIKSVSPAQ